MGKDPFEGSAAVVERPEFSRAGDGDRTYKWKGDEYTRVTEVLSIAPGQFLNSWAAKVAALRSAAPLVHAGLYTPDMGDDFQAELEKYVDMEAIRVVDALDAIAQSCNWASNMREPERYRDHKARIGQVVHHASYDYALGHRVRPTDWIDYLKATALDLKLISPELEARFESYGKSLDNVVTDLAHHALPRVSSKLQWINTFMPDYVAIGKGAAVFHEGFMVAGTPDEIYDQPRGPYEKAGKQWPFGSMPKARILSDDKTTNRTRVKNHAVQVATYARGSFMGLYSDLSEHPVPDVDAIAVLYIPPDGECDSWLFIGEEKIDELYGAFCGLNDYYRCMHDMPRSERSRKYIEPKPRKGSRQCPI